MNANSTPKRLPGRPKQPTTARNQAIIAMAQNGTPAAEIASAYAISMAAVVCVLSRARKAGVKIAKEKRGPKFRMAA